MSSKGLFAWRFGRFAYSKHRRTSIIGYLHLFGRVWWKRTKAKHPVLVHPEAHINPMFFMCLLMVFLLI